MNTRDKILNTLYHLIAEHGYENTSIAMISDGLGIKKPSIYYYFKSKEEMFLTLYEEIVMNDDCFKFNFDLDRETYKQYLYDFGKKMIETFEKDKTYVAVSIEFYLQSGRISNLENVIRQSEKRYRETFEAILTYGKKISLFPGDFDTTLNMQILANTLQGIESSIVFKFPSDNQAIWEKTVTRMFKSYDC